MGRPEIENKRSRQFNLSLTAEEFDAIQTSARLAGMRPVDYGRARLLKAGRVPRTAYAVRQLDPLLLAHLGRVGNNLNQIARRLNELAVPAPEALAALLDELRAAIRQARGE